ncbi:hypothetical protein NHX12_006290 [Muraenolepis orangiensis]|uniref:Flavodoxin-like fold domain-containing protein n=1 Tax=Muraenolepis orangiensis TaxID=630683 RepID=A0A9Q0DWQ4_9TELE|nr:hypothetical protein NHX12_006290 [Muraenolepis orangiensis]
MHAWMEDRLSDDIVAEQRKVEEAELIIFQFPMYWFSVPAIMKGWMDRVLAQGFAFSLDKMYNNGIFKDKKAMLAFSTGASQTMFQPDGVNGDINVSLWPLQVLAPQIFWGPAHCPAQVIVEKVSGSQIVDIDKRKYLVPSDITVAQFMWIIRKRIQMPSEKAIYLFVDKTVPQSSITMGQLYEKEKDEDGFLYVAYSGENTFGF